MDAIRSGLERGLSLLREFVHRDRELQAEFERSRVEFFGGTTESPEALADRRHLEWFLLERPSSALGGVPMRVLEEPLRSRLDAAGARACAALLESLAGVFEVSSKPSGEGIWVRDLFGLGEYPILEPQAACELEPGDLLVGRLFPLEGGAFALSPAACCFRNARLTEAVREDLGRMRLVRRGVLRVQQIELERLFFTHGSSSPQAVSPKAAARDRARGILETAGLGAGEVGMVLAELDRAAGRGDGTAVTEILDRLAFETEVDLGLVQRALAELWTAERAAGEPGAADRSTGSDAKAALEAFDRGRAQGMDLEDLFRNLEQDLGVGREGPEPADGESEGVPDFPGVVGAMVEEFLWDVRRERGESAARRWAGLQRLGSYGREIGVFEQLGAPELLDFTGRWLLDEGNLSGPEEAREVLSALAAFCRWSEERQAHPLWRAFGQTLQALRRSVPRLVRCRQSGLPGVTDGGTGPFTVTRFERSELVLTDLQGHERRLTAPSEQRAHLRPGDVVRLSERQGVPALGACYPGELLSSLRSRGSAPR